MFIIKQLFIKQQKNQYTLVKIALRNIYDVESFFVLTISLWVQMLFLKFQCVFFQNTYEQPLLLTLSWRRPLSYRNQPIDLRSKSVIYMITASVIKGLNYNYLALICKIFGTDWMNLLVSVLNEEGDLNCAW